MRATLLSAKIHGSQHSARGQGLPATTRQAVAAYSSKQRRITTSMAALPTFIPVTEARQVEELAGVEMMSAIKRAPVAVPSLGTIDTAWVGPDATYSSMASSSSASSADLDDQAAPGAERPLFVLLHGFDSSCLEFRRFHPRLAALGDAYAVDLAGWGFSDYTPFVSGAELALGPQQKREHLLAFLEQVVGAGSGRRVVLVGTSLGGAVAIDFAVHHPELVERLVLMDAQGFIDGIGPMSALPRWLAMLGIRFLRSDPLRQAANKMAYFDKQRYATDDARRIAGLHTHAEGWAEACLAFMRSGGYALSSRIPEIKMPTLVVWGRHDEILDPKYAAMFMDALPHAQLVWIEECGHCAHLEQPEALLDAVRNFVNGDDARSSTAARQVALT